MVKIFRRLAPWALAPAILGTPQIAQAACLGNGPSRLVLVADGVRSGSGDMVFTVYPDDRSRFLKSHGKLARIRTAAVKGATGACFMLPAGSYAVAVYHDENGDHDFNRTLFGPKEGFAFSNDAPALLGLPSLANVRFQLPGGGRAVRMKMRYP